jgi:hypothetical protein
MPIGFVGPALQGASFLGRVAIPLAQQLGISAGIAGLGAAANAFANMPAAKSQGTRRNAARRSPGGLMQRPPMPGLPAGYKEQELAAGMAAERFRPGAGFVGQQFASPAERAYQSEVSRVAQMTAQDPELQRYERARQMAVAPGATPEQVQSAEDIGMQIWAAKNPTLAAKVKPGQAGYDIIQGTMAGQAAAQGFGYQMPQQIMMTPPPGVNSPQGLPAVQSFGPSAGYGSEGIEVDPEMAKKFQALLNQTKG